MFCRGQVRDGLPRVGPPSSAPVVGLRYGTQGIAAAWGPMYGGSWKGRQWFTRGQLREIHCSRIIGATMTDFVSYLRISTFLEKMSPSSATSWRHLQELDEMCLCQSARVSAGPCVRPGPQL